MAEEQGLCGLAEPEGQEFWELPCYQVLGHSGARQVLEKMYDLGKAVSLPELDRCLDGTNVSKVWMANQSNIGNIEISGERGHKRYELTPQIRHGIKYLRQNPGAFPES
ncbi:MAG: hypothetical protein JW727_05670 [Candidatus Aenigmarchaeota archaeon]|nr:hypothetical protein [Candidatus Aenigmarchaeota archaeon]